MKYPRRQCKAQEVNNDDDMSKFNTSKRESASTSPIPPQMLRQNSSTGRELYYI
ncbi:hypothetical protein IC582_009063 [Cucumis melo]